MSLDTDCKAGKIDPPYHPTSLQTAFKYHTDWGMSKFKRIPHKIRLVFLCLYFQLLGIMSLHWLKIKRGVEQFGMETHCENVTFNFRSFTLTLHGHFDFYAKFIHFHAIFVISFKRDYPTKVLLLDYINQNGMLNECCYDGGKKSSYLETLTGRKLFMH